MPKGYKLPKTIAKERSREITRQIITERLEELLAAQIDNALGIRHLMRRDPSTGKFERIAGRGESPELEQAQIDTALKTGSAFWIYTKDPSMQAFTDLMNRALDKPAEQIKHTGDDSGPIIIKWRELE
jgi:hypothetical protein